MSEKRGVNPLPLLFGLAAGVAGAMFFSKKANQKKAVGTFEKALKTVRETLSDVSSLANQGELDAPKKRVVSKKKK